MQRKRWIRLWGFRALLAIALAIALMGVLLVVSPRHAHLAIFQISSVLAYALGQADICTLRQATRAPMTTLRQSEGLASMRESCREVSKVPEGYTLWRTPNGNIWFPSSSTSALFLIAEQQRNIYNSDGKGVAAGDIVLDCGAHVGLYTREALACGAKLVVAIEPAPENLECLRRNMAEEIRAGKVIVYPKGVWDKEDFLLLHRGPTNSAADSVVSPHAGDSVRVALTTIDQLVQELRLERIDFIKMDIEGAERQALSGAANTLRKFKPRMSLAVYHLPGDSLEIPRRVMASAPGYHSDCSCVVAGLLKVSPEVVHFY